jgi:hypothetical protein
VAGALRRRAASARGQLFQHVAVADLGAHEVDAARSSATSTAMLVISVPTAPGTRWPCARRSATIT